MSLNEAAGGKGHSSHVTTLHPYTRPNVGSAPTSASPWRRINRRQLPRPKTCAMFEDGPAQPAPAASSATNAGKALCVQRGPLSSGMMPERLHTCSPHAKAVIRRALCLGKAWAPFIRTCAETCGVWSVSPRLPSLSRNVQQAARHRAQTATNVAKRCCSRRKTN
jgi:hypothetical protein